MDYFSVINKISHVIFLLRTTPLFNNHNTISIISSTKSFCISDRQMAFSTHTARAEASGIYI